MSPRASGGPWGRTPLEVLHRVFGHRAFRPGQEELVKRLLEGQDVLGVMPTGAGKSVCYQVPALLRPGVTVVFSPLISLMKDQVDALRQSGVAAQALHSSLGEGEFREVVLALRSGECLLIYVAPERLESATFLKLLATLPVEFFVVDEAHCVSQWGHDFRPAYLAIASALKALPRRPPVGAFTATATPEVRKDIEKKLDLRSPFSLTTSFDRPNLLLRVERPEDKEAFLRSFVAARPRKSGIVYCATRRAVDSTWDLLRRSGIAATRYHAGLEDRERVKNQEDFLHDRALVVVATNAFGMGIDKSDVRYVLHYHMTKSLESYYQEAGRAGRDGEPAECPLLFDAKDVQIARFLVCQGRDREGVRRDLKKLQDMTSYCRASGCLRERLLGYFGDRPPAVPCGGCGPCLGAPRKVQIVSFFRSLRPSILPHPPISLTPALPPTPSLPPAPAPGEDVTLEAKKIISCVYRMAERSSGGAFPLPLLVAVLRGSRSRRVRELGFQALSTWGLLKDTPPQRIQEVVAFLEARGLLASADRGLCFTAATRPFLRSDAPLFMVPLAPDAPEDAPPKPDGKEILFEKLREMRRAIAQEEGVPPFVIFPDSTLREMCRRLPATSEALLAISGVGNVKLERYGERFLRVVNGWVTGSSEA